MAYKKQDFSALANFMPPNCLEDVLEYIYKNKIHIKVTPNRNSIYGNYCYNPQLQKHTITVNGTLNIYSFLVTLLHEIAHCITYIQYAHHAAPHGIEWQKNYSILLQQFIAKNVFPEALHKALQKNINAPKASSCSDATLQKALQLYDAPQDDVVYIEQLPMHSYFITPKGMVFKKELKRRTRYLCTQVYTNVQFLFPALYKVKPYTLATP